MALSKYYTLKDTEEILRDLVNEIAPDKVQSLDFKDYINLSVDEIANMIDGAAQPDYGSRQVVSDAASSYAALPTTGGEYAFATRTITRAGHGLTSADIGKRIAFWDSTADPITKVALATIESITDVNSFVVSSSNNSANITAPNCDYAIFGSHSSTSIDLSPYKVHKVIKLKDSINGLVLPAGDSEFEGISGNSRKQNNCWYNQFGETLELIKGTGISAWGTLTLYYYRQPDHVVDETDHLDIKDQYVSLVIMKAKLYVYERLNKQVPPDLSNNITAEIKRQNLEEQAQINAAKKK